MQLFFFRASKGGDYSSEVIIQGKYCKIPIISPGLIFAQKTFFVGLFLGKLIIGGAYYWREFCISKWVGLDNKNSLKH